MSLAPEIQRQYAALTTGVGVVDVSDRTQLELTGADRASFLHNLCTNAVRDLAAGNGCEAFILNVKGHVIGHVFVFAGPSSHVVETVPAQAATLVAHLDRYLIREDVQLYDRSSEWGELLLAGPKSQSLLEGLGVPPPNDRLAHAAATLPSPGVATPGLSQIWLRRLDLLGPVGFLIAGHRETMQQVAAQIEASGAERCSAEAAEIARIEYGMPLFGRDINEDNLPQEIARDAQAISFTKGCYLGQETVARIDALGHVNRLLRGVRFQSDTVPSPGIQLHADKKAVGQVTSACWSPRLASPLALAFVRRGQHETGTHLDTDLGPAEVVELPVS